MQKFILRFLYCYLLKWILKIFVGVSFSETDFLKEEKQFVILANHNSHLDTICMMAALPPSIIQNVMPVAAADYFGKTHLSTRLSTYFINTLLISRRTSKESPEEHPIQKMIAELDSGKSLILFPEGTRGEPEVLQPFKRGIALVLAQRPHIKYVPAYMNGMGKTLPKGERVLVPINSYLKFGKPTVILSSNTKEIIQQIEKDIIELKEV